MTKYKKKKHIRKMMIRHCCGGCIHWLYKGSVNTLTGNEAYGLCEKYAMYNCYSEIKIYCEFYATRILFNWLR